MNLKAVSGIMLTLLIVGTLNLTFYIKAEVGIETAHPLDVIRYDVATGKETLLKREDLKRHSDEGGLELERLRPFKGLLSSIETGVGPKSVIPPDDDRVRIDRTTEWPYRTIVALNVTTPAWLTGIIGTGAMVGPYHVLTAAHCVYNLNWPTANKYIRKGEVIPGLNGTRKPLAWANVPQPTIDNIYTYAAWRDDEDKRYDIALLVLDRNLGLYTGWMGLMSAPRDDPVYTGVLHVAGYPEYVRGSEVMGYMYYDSDQGYKARAYFHWYDMDTSGGMSGSPVWVYDSGEPYILTVHAYGWDEPDNPEPGHNFGTRINFQKFDDIIRWIDESPPPTDYADLMYAGDEYAGFFPNNVVRGQTYFSVWARVRNVGTAASGAFVVHFVASLNTIIGDSDDYIIASQDVSSISPLGSRGVWWSGPFPVYLYSGYFFPPGSYRVGLIIDANHQVTEFDEDNNFPGIPSSDYLHVWNNPPVADANGPYYGTEGFPMTFLGSGSYDREGSLFSYEWAFGDGNTGTGVSPTHTYTQQGGYTVTLTVTDYDGATDTDQTIAIIGEALPWFIEIVDSEMVSTYSSIALDSWNRPHISYFDATNYDLKYAKWDGIAWSIETVDSEEKVGWYTSIALDSSDKPHISYVAPWTELKPSYDLKYARKSGDTWIIETLDSERWSWRETSIALDSGDKPHISYYDYGMWDLRYARWTGTAWIIETIDSEGDVGRYSSIALDSSGNPHISYYDQTNQALKYAEWTGVDWSIETVPDPGVDVGRYSSIALDSSGNPFISYYDEASGDLKFAQRFGALPWIISTADTSGDVGLWTSIALDSDNHPHISYYDQTSDALKYTWHPGGGASWPIWTVEQGSYLRAHASIALDSWDNPHISYLSSAGLKYAFLPPPNQPPSADAGGPYSGDEGDSLPFSGSGSNDPDGNTIVSYDWNFGDGSTGTGVNVTHTYTQQGNYTVVLIVTDDDGATDTDITYAVISDTEPTADYSGTPTSGPEPLTVVFTDLSTSYDGIASWEWDFDNDGVVDSTDQNPTHVYDQEGVYTVTLTVYEGDGDTDTKTKVDYIVVSDTEPVADFSAYPRGGNQPLTVSFTDLSTSYDGIVSWLWNFGDGQTSTEQNPTHTYTNEGVYTVSLTVNEVDGDSAIETKVNYIIVGLINVVFEEAHLPIFTIGSNPAYETTGGYAEFANYLTANGYLVSTIDPGTTIDSAVLAPVDVLVIVVPMQSYSTSEIDAIETWVKGGGRLLLITDYGNYGAEVSTIATRFGITLAFDAILDSDENAGYSSWPYYDGANLLVHPVTAGVARVEMYGNDGIPSAPADEIPLIVTDSDGTATWYFAGSPALGVSLMSAIDRGGTAGSGRLIVITDGNVWDSAYDADGDGDLDFYDSDNEILALNAINWLSAAIPGDCDGDGDVDYDDLVVLALAYGSSSGDPAYDARADFDGDGDVDYDDLVLLAINYGTGI